MSFYAILGQIWKCRNSAIFFCLNFPSALCCFGISDVLIHILHACIVNVLGLYACIVVIIGLHCTYLHCWCCSPFLLAQNSQLRDTLLTLWWTSTRTYRWPRTSSFQTALKTGCMGSALPLLSYLVENCSSWSSFTKEDSNPTPYQL